MLAQKSAEAFQNCKKVNLVYNNFLGKIDEKSWYSCPHYYVGQRISFFIMGICIKAHTA
jgi:hypothetical protein